MAAPVGLKHWGRDRSRGPGLPPPQLVKMQTSETADFFDFANRGRHATPKNDGRIETVLDG